MAYIDHKSSQLQLKRKYKISNYTTKVIRVNRKSVVHFAKLNFLVLEKYYIESGIPRRHSSHHELSCLPL